MLLDVYTQEEIEREEGEQWARSEARLHRLLSEKQQLAEELRQTRESLQVQSDGWRRERSKATALMFSMSLWPLLTLHSDFPYICSYTLLFSCFHNIQVNYR